MMVDFHIHSRYSDGGKTVEDIIKICKENDINFISITDHNSFKSYKELQKSNVRFITGMEIDTKYKDNVFHMLLYNFDYESTSIRKYNQQNRKYEIKNFRLMIEELETKYNMKFEQKLVKEFIRNNNYFDKTRLNDLIVLSGFANNPTESFYKYTKEIKEFKRYKISMKKLFEIEKESNGVVSLAHPLYYNIDIDIIENIILDLKNTFNLRVVEAINNRQTLDEEKRLINFCKKNDLLISGGSDAHYKFGAKPGKIIGIVHDKKIELERLTFLSLVTKEG